MMENEKWMEVNPGMIPHSHDGSARGQSSIFAGKGGFDISVEKNDLTGAVIASEATAEKNRLSTGTVSFSDLKTQEIAERIGVFV